jgi:Spy/CpxP family protein refolding chaperone
MTRKWKILLGMSAVALAATAASAAYAQATASNDQATPSNFNWEIKDGKRVPKGQRQVASDGSWREEIRQGKCVTVKEKSTAGEYKESRKCD